MLVGVAALALAFYLSRLGKLAALNWLISTLLPYTVFALIVVFAAEIRQALARLGRGLTLSRSVGFGGGRLRRHCAGRQPVLPEPDRGSDRHRA